MASGMPILLPGQPEKPSPITVLTALAAERMRRDCQLFMRRAWPVIEPKPCVWNWHMDAILEHLVYVTQGDIRFLMVCVPPRSTKSLLGSVGWPVWHWLQRPQTQFICASYTTELSGGFAGLARRLMESSWFQQFYGHLFYLLPDDNKRDFYRNNRGGYRISTSVKGGITTGLGGDIQVLDDPLSADDALSDAETNNALIWHDGVWRSRVNDPNRSQKVYIAQRLRENDILGHVAEREGHRWVKLILPMEYEKKHFCVTFKNDGTGIKPNDPPIFTDPRKVEGELLNPMRFNSITAETERDTVGQRTWNAQYQQRPEGQGGLILKRHWWRPWVYPDWHPQAGKPRELPQFIEVAQVYDTAMEEDEEADYSARTTWGVFALNEQEKDPKTGRLVDRRQRICALLLDMMEEQLEFPDLRSEVIASAKHWDPDVILIEKKASGHSLIQELRRKRLPVKAVKIPTKDKVARAKQASVMLEQGCIFYVPTRKEALHVIDRAAKFPGGPKDIVDTLSMAWQYMRRHSDLTLNDDDTDEEISPFKWRSIRYG